MPWLLCVVSCGCGYEAGDGSKIALWTQNYERFGALSETGEEGKNNGVDLPLSLMSCF
jgi:hypothetical protein